MSELHFDESAIDLDFDGEDVAEGPGGLGARFGSAEGVLGLLAPGGDTFYMEFALAAVPALLLALLL